MVLSDSQIAISELGRRAFSQALETLQKSIRGQNSITENIDPEVYDIPRNLDIFPRTLGSYQRNVQALELPLQYTLTQLKSMFQRSHKEDDHIEDIYVSSAEYCKQTVDAKHEFLLVEVKDERIPQISNWIVLDRTISASTHSVFVSTSVSSSSPAQDRLRVSCYGKKDLLTKQCGLMPYEVLERVTLPSSPSSTPLLLCELVILALETSRSRFMYNLMSAQCFWFASCVWESMRRLVRGAWHIQILANNSRGKFGKFFQQGVDNLEVEDILYKTKSEVMQFRMELARGKEFIDRAKSSISEKIPRYKNDNEDLKNELERLIQSATGNDISPSVNGHNKQGVRSEDIRPVESEEEKLGGQLEALNYTNTGVTSMQVEQEAVKAKIPGPRPNNEAERQIEDLGKGIKESPRIGQEEENMAREQGRTTAGSVALEQETRGAAVSSVPHVHKAGIRESSVDPQIYKIPCNVHIFPSGLGSYGSSKQKLHHPLLYTLSQLKTLLLQSSTEQDHVENIYVFSAEYCKQSDHVKHEFLLLEIRDKLIPTLSNFAVLERTVQIPQSGDLPALFSSSSVDIPAQDRLRFSCYGKKEHLVKQCSLAPYEVLDRVELHSSSSSPPLLLWQLVVLALETSESRLMYSLVKAQCFWFAGCIWECMMKLRPDSYRTTLAANKNRGKFKIFRQNVNLREIYEILENTESGIKQCQEELNAKNAASNSLDPEKEDLRRENEKMRIQLQQMLLNVANAPSARD